MTVILGGGSVDVLREEPSPVSLREDLPLAAFAASEADEDMLVDRLEDLSGAVAFSHFASTACPDPVAMGAEIVSPNDSEK